MPEHSDIQIEVKDKEVRELIAKLKAKMQDLTPVMRRIGEVIIFSVQQNFETGGRYLSKNSWQGGSRKWDELSEATIKKRTDKGYWPGKILIQRARLASSINYKADPDSVTVGTNTKYAAIMQFGAKKGEFGTKTFTQRVKEHIRNIHGKAVNVRAHERTVTLPLPWGNIPPRPYLVIQPEDMLDIKEIINAYLAN